MNAKNLLSGLKLDIMEPGWFHIWDVSVLKPLLVIKSNIQCIGIYEVGPMGEYHKECQECGWRGSSAELDETSDAPTGKTQNFCPDCGGKDFEDLNPDEKTQALEQ